MRVRQITQPYVLWRFVPLYFWDCHFKTLIAGNLLRPSHDAARIHRAQLAPDSLHQKVPRYIMFMDANRQISFPRDTLFILRSLHPEWILKKPCYFLNHPLRAGHASGFHDLPCHVGSGRGYSRRVWRTFPCHLPDHPHTCAVRWQVEYSSCCS